jgi:1,2-diacylglycerol 3-alpha-glucosyltransferase
MILKILLTTDTFYPMVNGVVISTQNLYKQLKNLGNDVKILTLSPTGEEKIDGDIYYLKSFGVSIYPNARAKSFMHNKLKKRSSNGSQISFIHKQNFQPCLFLRI